MPEGSTHVVLVDDHRLFGAALGTALAAEGFSVTVPELTDLALLCRVVLDEAPDVILLDLDLGAAGSGEGLLAEFVGSGAAVLIVSGTTDDAVRGRCLDQGVAGWMSKCAPFDELLESVRAVAAGAPGPRPARPPAHPQGYAAPCSSFEWLTPRESAVLAMLMDGQSVARIAAAWYVSETTVRTQVRAVLQKLGVNSQLEAVALATRAGWSLTAAAAAQSSRRPRSVRRATHDASCQAPREFRNECVGTLMISPRLMMFQHGGASRMDGPTGSRSVPRPEGRRADSQPGRPSHPEGVARSTTPKGVVGRTRRQHVRHLQTTTTRLARWRVGGSGWWLRIHGQQHGGCVERRCGRWHDLRVRRVGCVVHVGHQPAHAGRYLHPAGELLAHPGQCAGKQRPGLVRGRQRQLCQRLLQLHADGGNATKSYWNCQNPNQINSYQWAATGAADQLHVSASQ